MASFHAALRGTGLGIPSKVLTNEDLAKFVDTNDEWIRTRTGIRERRLLDREKGESLSLLGAQAAQEALDKAGIKAEELDAVICCTATPDTWMPISASRILGHLRGRVAVDVFTADLNAACSGYLAGLHVANNFIRSGLHKKVLVVGGDIFSSIIDWTDRTTCILFGDGVGASVLEAVEEADASTAPVILGARFGTLADFDHFLAVEGGGSAAPFTSAEFESRKKRPVISMNGQEVFKLACKHMAQKAHEVLADSGYTTRDVRWFVPHQANLRIIEMVARMAEMPMDRVYVNVDRWGNTSAGTVAVALAEMQRGGMLKKGDLVLLDVFGGGFTYGAMLLRWGTDAT